MSIPRARDGSVRRPRVLWSIGPLASQDNPYVLELAEALSADVDLETLSATATLRARPDVFHVHWPAQLSRADGRAKTLVKRALTTLLLLRLKARRTPVVLTVHNRASHEPERRSERRILRLLDRLIAVRIFLNESPDNDLGDGVVILHPHYRSWLADHGLTGGERTPDRDLLLFGQLRPYKGIDALIDAADAAGATLTLTGRALDPAYGEALRHRAASSPTTELVMRQRTDAELVAEIHRHRLVCLPYPDMYNSGALLYALSVGRPVLAPRSPANDALAREVGDGWLLLYDGPLTADIIRDALPRAAITGAPDLSRRDPAASASLHASLYRALLRLPRGADARAAILRDPAFAAHSPRNAPATHTL